MRGRLESPHHHTGGRRKKGVFWLLVAAVVFAVLALSAFYVWKAQSRPSITRANNAIAAMTGGETGTDFQNAITQDGVRYTYRHDIKNILFLGVDQNQTSDVSGAIGGGGRTDAMMLFILDPKQENATMLEISRDTIVPVDVYGDHDNYLYSGDMQLTMQYAFGSSARRSCWLTKKKVSELLCGIPIAGTVSFTMDGIAAVVDVLGGIEIAVPQDYTDLNPAFGAGKTITMDGELAVSYVRYRDTELTGSNDTRMQRQEQLLQAVYKQLGGAGQETWEKIQSAAEPYSYTDVDAETLQALYGYQLAEKMYKVPGQTVQGELHDEYQVDAQALQQQILQLMYEPQQ